MRSSFEFAGRSSLEFYLTVEKLPIISVPAKKYKTVSVAGRNGDLHIEEHAFQNYTQPYECWFRRPDLPASKVAHELKSWLMGSSGAQILQDTYDPECFRRATYVGGMDIERLLNRYGRCTIQFDCAPQFFLKSGEFQVNFENAGTLQNPTAFTALPLIRVYGTGAGILNIGDTTVQILSLEETLVLDCEMQNAYTESAAGVAVNKNTSIYAPEFPTLMPGSNEISWGGNIERVEIIPRWWQL